MRLDTVVSSLGTPIITVIGDLMLDVYRVGQVDSMSHEAPVPVLRLNQTEYRLGGAASVAGMLKELGATPLLIGMVGRDEHGKLLRERLQLQNISCDYLVMGNRPTTYKERLVGMTHGTNRQQLLRVDIEERRGIRYTEFEAMIEAALLQSDTVLISDYAKGVCTYELIRRLVDWPNMHAGFCHSKFLIADPARSATWMKYSGVNCIVPNRQELSALLGHTEHCLDNTRAIELLNDMCEKMRGTRVVVKLDRDGMMMGGWPSDSASLENYVYFKAVPRDISDPTGAGDMVLSILGIGLASGLDYYHSCLLANHAGGLMVERFGASPISKNELSRSIHLDKIYKLDDLIAEVNRLHSTGKRIVFTSGCFDILHPGHMQLLREASKQGDFLIVAVMDDESVRVLKGPKRPALTLEARCNILSVLPTVDAIVAFTTPTPLHLIGVLKPNCLVQGDNGLEQVVGAAEVESWGGLVYMVKRLADYSTSRMLANVDQSEPG